MPRDEDRDDRDRRDSRRDDRRDDRRSGDRRDDRRSERRSRERRDDRGRDNGRFEDELTESTSLLIRNVSYRVRSDEIRQIMAKYGEVRDVYIPTDYSTNRPRGFAFVEFLDPRDAKEAKNNVDGTEMDGRAVTIVFARQKRKTPEEMRRDGRRGDSRGRRGDHGRRGSSRDRRGRSRSRDRGGDRDRGYGGREERGRDRNRSPSGSPAKRRDDSYDNNRNGKDSSRDRERSPSPQHSRERRNSKSISRSNSPQRGNMSPETHSDKE